MRAAASRWMQQHPWSRPVLALLCGATLTSAFDPIGGWPLGLFAMGVLVWLWRDLHHAWRAAQLGFAFGLGLFLSGVSWIAVSLHVFGGMPMALAAFATLLFCVYLALYPALVGALCVWLSPPGPRRTLFAVPVLWCLFEWLRSVVFTGFPWLTLGYAGTQAPFAGFAPIVGVFGVSLVVLWVVGILVELIRHWAHADVQTTTHRSVVHWVLTLCVLLGAGVLLQRIEWTQANGTPLTVSLLQGNVAQDLKFDPHRYANTVQTYTDLAFQSQARLIVLPETALPRFLDQIEPDTLHTLRAIAQRNQGALLLGVPERTDPSTYYNAAISLDDAPMQYYRKQHLVPFGEFIPPGLEAVLHVLHIPMSDFSRGPITQPPMRIAGQQVAVNICYEDAFGAERAPAAAQATLLANVSNVAWFGDSLAPGQHLQIARMRALETQRAFISATNTGITAAIDRDGRVIARLPQFTIGRLDTSVQGYTGLTPYLRWKDTPLICLLCVGVIALFVLRDRR